MGHDDFQPPGLVEPEKDDDDRMYGVLSDLASLDTHDVNLRDNPRGCACAPDPTLKPDIAALKKRLAEDPGFAAEVTGDKPPTPGCHTPEGCRENGCLGWCDEYKPEGPKP